MIAYTQKWYDIEIRLHEILLRIYNDKKNEEMGLFFI